MEEKDIYDAQQFETSEDGPIIKVIGVGGGGCNAVNYMFKQNIPNVDFVLCNTDKGALSKQDIPHKVVLGYELTHGLGAGNKPEIGRQCAEASADEIRKLFVRPTEMVFITAGMGGGTGTGAAPVVARLAKEAGMLTIGIVTVPFAFEGETKILKALKGAEEMKAHVDALLVINNENLISLYKDYTLFNAFSKADDTLANAARSISEIISEELYINVDYQDVRTVLTDAGTAIISTAYGEGKSRISDAIENALHSPLLKRHDIKTAKRLLLKVVCSQNADNPVQTSEIEEIHRFTAQLPKTIDVKWGIGDNPDLGDKVKVTVLAAGFDVTLRESTAATDDQGIIFGGMLEEDIQEKREETATEKQDPAPVGADIIADVYGEQMVWGNTLTKNRAKYAVLRPDHFDNDEVIRQLEREPAINRSRAFREFLNSTDTKPLPIETADSPAHPSDNQTINF